jgi:hypothetical protein
MRTTYVYSKGLIHCSACADENATKEQVADDVNRKYPTGVSSPWAVSDATAFADGKLNGCPCEDAPNRRHWLLSC